jgi:hypothetical protein
VLRLCREVISSRLVAGKDIDANALRWLSEQLERYAPPPEPACSLCRRRSAPAVAARSSASLIRRPRCVYCRRRRLCQEGSTMPDPAPGAFITTRPGA